eukprot:TRINITY_DN109388_c0_g1_i1.p1 TRINITY_DN109388_c0_g1~~TRINITY_DN109388_c0_g1_i1.p1  ORF type:complete len:374 (-),score=55.84 TRINITY_DN109388_c0_g1_i1:135-1157(-)
MAGKGTIKERRKRLRELFVRFDQDGDEKLSQTEILAMIASLGVTSSRRKKKALAMLPLAIESDEDGWSRKSVSVRSLVSSLRKPGRHLCFESFAKWAFSAPQLLRYFDLVADLKNAHVQEATRKAEKLTLQMVKCAPSSSEREIKYSRRLAYGKAIVRILGRIQEKYEANSNSQLSPLASEIFAWYDRYSCNMLAFEEGFQFLTDFVEQLERTVLWQARADLRLRMLESISKFHSLAEFEAGVEHAEGLLDVRIGSLLDVYWTQVADRHAAAFEVLDVDRRNILTEKEVVNAMLPGSPTSRSVRKALGFRLSRSELDSFIRIALTESLQGKSMMHEFSFG